MAEMAEMDLMMSDTQTRLYLITPPKIEVEGFSKHLKEALEGGDVASVQLRMKNCTDEAIIEASKILMPICHAKDVAFIINYRPDIAKKVGADGVHVGQEDTDLIKARQIVGNNKTIGVTAKNSRHLAMTAGDLGADYVAFGAFFPTATKENTTPADIDILTWWQELFEIPCVAIGGITVDNAKAISLAGADFIAVSSGVWDYSEGAKAAVKKFNEILNQNPK